MKTKKLLVLAVAIFAAAFLHASAVAAELTVQWDDNSTDETGFAIERAPAGAGAVFGEVGRVAKDVKTFTDTTLAAGTLYQFRIRAFNTGGYSDYSNTASGTTLPNPPVAPGNNRVPEPTPLVTVTLKPGGQLMVMAEVAQR